VLKRHAEVGRGWTCCVPPNRDKVRTPRDAPFRERARMTGRASALRKDEVHGAGVARSRVADCFLGVVQTITNLRTRLRRRCRCGVAAASLIRSDPDELRG